MPLDEAHRLGSGSFRGGGSLFCCLCRPSSGSLPRLLAVLPFLPKPFPGTLLQLRVLLGGHAELMIRRSLDIFGLRPLDSLCRVFPDFLLDEAGAMPQGGFTRQLGAVGPLGAHILLFHLKELAMHEAVNGAASGPAHPPHRAGLFGWLLLCQLIFGCLQLFPALFHTELGRGGLFLLALLPEF